MRMEAIRRRIAAARQAVGAGETIVLSELAAEVHAVCESLRAAPLQMDREAVARDIETILVDLNRLEQELTAQHEAAGDNGNAG